MIQVQIAQVPGGAMQNPTLEDNATVGDALRSTQLSVPAGYGLQVDGVDATESTTLYNGARVVITKGAKGAQ